MTNRINIRYKSPSHESSRTKKYAACAAYSLSFDWKGYMPWRIESARSSSWSEGSDRVSVKSWPSPSSS